MTDRKHGNEPSLFDLPLRRTPGEAGERERGTESGTEPGTEQDAESSAEPASEGTGDRPPGARGRDGAAEVRDEPPFWETEPAADAHREPADTPARAAGPRPGLSEEGDDRPGAGGKGVETGEGAADWADLEAGEPAGGADEAGRAPGERPAAVPAALTHRLAASLLDGGVLLVVTAGAILGAFLLGVRWQADDLPALGMFLLVFSFVYSVMPLAFWGRTPGMALARVLSRGADGGPLTFGQTALRWLAGLLTVALAGLPLLLSLPALGGRSLADRLSGSHTWLQPEA